MTTPQIYLDNGSFYLIQDISGLDKYERAKAITKFVNKGTKMLEYHLESEINNIFLRNQIQIPINNKESVKKALLKLKNKGKQIEIIDLFGGKDFRHCEKITTTKSNMTIVIEDGNYIECGVNVSEARI